MEWAACRFGVISAACVATAPECSGEQVIRVLVAEDTRAVRDTLTALLDLEPDIEVAGAVASGDQVVPAALAHRPDVALLDIGLPGTDGIAAAGDVARRVPGCRVLILTGLQAPGHLDAARRAGAHGFLLKDGPAGELIAAVRAVARGEQMIDTRLSSQAPRGQGGPRGPG